MKELDVLIRISKTRQDFIRMLTEPGRSGPQGTRRFGQLDGNADLFDRFYPIGTLIGK